MELFRRVNLKLLIMPIIIITFITCIIMTITNIYQYSRLSQILNDKVASIIGEIVQKYPDVDTQNIVQILNVNSESSGYIIGKDELLKYGINIENIDSIVSIETEKKSNIITNVVILISFNIFWAITIYIYLNRRDKQIKKITKYINQIRNKNYTLSIEENSEDELSQLKNELYKITIMLKEESESSKKDKDNLKVAMQDISHQIKTPLTSISIMLDNIKENPDMDIDTRKKFIFEIARQIEWINWLVISMLKLSKLEANVIEFHTEKINVRSIIGEIIKNLEIPIEIKNQNVIIEGNEKCTYIGDYKWQKEALTNIIKNCIEHTPENKSIYIKCEENNLYTKITIKDEGEGITREEQKNIFKRFYKGQNSPENSIGIGLALAKNIIEKENGIITCKSEKGKGTEFIIKYIKK